MNVNKAAQTGLAFGCTSEQIINYFRYSSKSDMALAMSMYAILHKPTPSCWRPYVNTSAICDAYYSQTFGEFKFHAIPTVYRSHKTVIASQLQHLFS